MNSVNLDKYSDPFFLGEIVRIFTSILKSAW